MRRKFNYTGRQRIPQTRTSFSISDSSEGVRRFNARLDLDGLGLTAEAKVYVEAFYKRTFMRFDFGSVGAILPPLDRELTDLERGDHLFFNVKVVDERGEHGLILASADGVSAEESATEPVGRRPILPVNHTAELGDLVWQLRIEESGGPVLEVNSLIPGIRDVVRTDRAFFSLVFPAVVREVLTHIVVLGEVHPEEVDGDTWQGVWIDFVKTFHFGDPPPEGADSEQMLAWIEEVVRSFASRHAVRESYTLNLEAEL